MDVELDGLFRHNTTYEYEDYEYEGDIESGGGTAVFISVLYCVVLVVGLIGNGFLLAVLALKRRSWSQSDTFVLHLSVADVLLLLTLPFWAAQATHTSGWYFGNFLCKFCGVVFNLWLYCSIFLLVCIVLDRYLSIVHAIQMYSQNRPRLVHISCLSVWIVSLLLTIPALIFMEARKDPGQEKTLCDHSQSASDQLLGSRLHHHTLGFLLPAAVLFIGCSCILLRLRRSSEGLQKHRAFIMVVLPLVVVFLLCWMPYNITLIVDTIRSHSKEPKDVQSGSTKGSLHTALTITKALCCIHACLRPLLYLGLCGNFRKRVINMLSCPTVEHEGSLWELGVGAEAPSDRSHNKEEEQKQMTSVDHQVPLNQC